MEILEPITETWCLGDMSKSKYIIIQNPAIFSFVSATDISIHNTSGKMCLWKEMIKKGEDCPAQVVLYSKEKCCSSFSIYAENIWTKLQPIRDPRLTANYVAYCGCA